jgi:hypothetical protein
VLAPSSIRKGQLAFWHSWCSPPRTGTVIPSSCTKGQAATGGRRW